MFANLRRHPYRVAILGFTDFERTSLASCLRLSEHRTPAYVQVDAAEAADFLVADADQAETAAGVGRERRAGDTVFVGALPPNEAVAWLPRPIDAAHVMRSLDGLLAVRLGTDDAGAATEPEVAAVATPTKRRPNRATAVAPSDGGGRRVLVVDDSRIARTFLAQRLAALGYRVGVASSADEALESSATETYAIVFLDLKLGDHDPLGGLSVCRSLKERRDAPAVVITTGSAVAADRVRGSLAGCDAYLVKPLLAADFDAALRQVDPLFAGRD